MESFSRNSKVAEESATALQELLSAANLAEARKASAPLLTTSIAAAAAKDERLSKAIERWWSKAREGSADDQLATIALLWRLTSLSSMAEHRRALIKDLVATNGWDLPPLNQLEDPKDRKAVADALTYSERNSKLASYAAKSIAIDPDPKSDSRDVMAEILINNADTIGESFSLLDSFLSELKLTQKDPASGMARRAAWILRSVQPALRKNDDAEAGDSFGVAYDSFVSRTLGRSEIDDRTAFIDGAREVILTLNLIVRMHGLALATTAVTYKSIGTLKRGIAGTAWPDELQSPIEKLAKKVQEALLVLAKQGIPDNDLRQVFELLLGKVLAKRRLMSLLSGRSDFDPQMKFWLETGTVMDRIETSSAIEESATSMVDIELARALREAQHADAAIQKGVSPDLPLRRMARELREAARKRGILLRGQPGDIVEFSPLEHEPDTSALGRRTVQIVSPVVERVIGDRSVRVLVKAEVTAGD